MVTKFYQLSESLKAIPLNLLKSLTGQYTIYPFYHTVSDEELKHIKHLYPVRSIKKFEKDLDFFLKHYHPIAIDDLLDSIKNGNQIKKNSFLLSFDDGLREFNDVIAPILLKKGIPAACFLNSAFIDNRDLFFRYKASILIEAMSQNSDSNKQKMVAEWFKAENMKVGPKSILSIGYKSRTLLDRLADVMEVDFKYYLNNQKPYMTAAQVKDLIRKGFFFGAHSVDHPLYSEIELDEQLKQTKSSLEYITTSFNLAYRLFSFPFTDHNVSGKFFDELFKKGEETVDVTFGSAGLKKDSCSGNIQRIPIEIKDFSAREIVTGEYLYFIFKALLNKNKIKRS